MTRWTTSSSSFLPTAFNGIPSFATGINSQGYSPPFKTDDLYNTLRQAASANDRAWVAANTAQNALSAATAAVQQAVMLIMNQKATGPALSEATPFGMQTPATSTAQGFAAISSMEDVNALCLGGPTDGILMHARLILEEAEADKHKQDQEGAEADRKNLWRHKKKKPTSAGGRRNTEPNMDGSVDVGDGLGAEEDEEHTGFL
mmetsp:Transcript_27824/g.70299  ORF Transcript_27824/g.70299 Transcript_27824/m.70299 type:complete len:203 (+) Transcript_27824:196-804(+)